MQNFSIKKYFNLFNSGPRRISLGLSLVKSARAILSIYSVILSAKYFGASFERDAWVLSSSIIMIISLMFFAPINETFRAKFTHLKEELGEREALNSYSALMSYILIICVILALVCIVGANTISKIFAPGIDANNSTILILMIKYQIPTLIFTEVSVIWLGLLNSYELFYIPDLFSLFSVLMNILIVIIFAPYLKIYALFISTYFSGALLLVTIIIIAKYRGINIIKLKVPKWDTIKIFLIFASPFYISYLFMQFQAATEKIFCSYLGPGSISILDYARKFIGLPMEVLISTVATVLTPLLAKLYSLQKKDEFNEKIIEFVRLFTFILLPIGTMFFISSTEFVQVVLLRGEFKENYVHDTSQTIKWMGLGLLGLSFYIVCGQALIARKRAITYSIFISLSMIILTALNYLLYKEYKVPAFGFSWTIVHILSGLLMFFIIFWKDMKRASLELIQLAVLITSTITISFIAKKILSIVVFHYPANNNVYNIINILFPLLVSILVIILNLFIFNNKEKKIIQLLYKKLLIKRA